jgi:DnaJ-class molecular chaperone
LARDPYQELGVARTASADEIRKAFRKLAKENHPDQNPGNKAAEERFKKVSAAFDIVGDPEKRKKFDRGEIDADGRETMGGFGGGPWGPGGHPGGGFGGGRQGGFRTETFEGVDLGDILGEMFGGARQGRAGDRPGGRDPRRQAAHRLLGRPHH